MKSFAPFHSAALLLLLTLSGTTEAAMAIGLPGLLALQIKGYTAYSSASLSTSGIAVTYDSTEKMCFDAGGVPASGANAGLSMEIARMMDANGGGKTSSIYTGASAAPSMEGTTCKDRTPQDDQGQSSASCYYRWRYGFYDMYSYDGEPGTAYWANLYRTETPASQILNQFEQLVWNSKLSPAGEAYPRGYYGVIASLEADRSGLLHMDAPLVPNDNDPYPKNEFMIVCEYQLYPERPPSTTRMPQPTFVNGFKDLTWSQSHWWVLFLIFALIICAILLAIFSYCCITSVRPKEEQPLFQMVIRERVGKGYIISNAPLVLPPQQEEHRRQLRYGRGFNPQEQKEEEEDMSVGVTGIFSNGERRFHAMGSVFGGSQGTPGESNLDDIGEGAFPPREQRQSNLVGLGGFESESTEPSLITSKRRITRRSRNHTASQAFSDIEMPQAGEINETNVDL
ncbi:hypothetical protein LSCM1_05946 [Leishmania martiniquensis]|uniref:Uncharacterized protein n=1 Tax=Leishmania martiniquensis TaxID=1580590 RepID=A0A836HTS7_9TRYP|nr:hypothetical protein LSCM1_05946 [Leishmania martiniquensis]